MSPFGRLTRCVFGQDPSAAEENLVHQAWGALNEQEVTVLTLRFGLGGSEPVTLQAIGSVIGRSRERVRQIEARGLTKLRSSIWTRSKAVAS